MRRSVAVFVLVLLALTSCSSSSDSGKSAARSTGPSVPVATIHKLVKKGNLCQRLAGSLDGQWRAAAETDVYVSAPVFDRCLLTESKDPQRPVSVGVSVLKATKADLDRSQLAYDNGYGQTVPSESLTIGDGGWGVNNNAKSYVVVLSGGRLIRLSRDGGARVYEELGKIAYVATSVTSNLPVAPARTTRPECSRGTPAAQRILDTRAVVRRDRLRGKRLTCLWGNATASVKVSSGDAESPEASTFRDLSTPGIRGVHKISVGDQGFYHPYTGIAFRLGRNRFVAVTAEPYYKVEQPDLVALARSLVAAYRG